jgi:hypothetical protein
MGQQLTLTAERSLRQQVSKGHVLPTVQLVVVVVVVVVVS